MFTHVKNYGDMLARIWFGSFTIGIIGTYYLRERILAIDKFLSNFDFEIEVFSINSQGGFIIPSVIMATLFRIFKMHDRLSDHIGIREEFEVNSILIPMAKAVGLETNSERRELLIRNRKNLMRDVFYEYASSSENKMQIDAHLVHTALDQWSWYWICVEGHVIALMTCVPFFLLWDFSGLLIPFFFSLFLLSLQTLIKRLCASNAETQVREILKNEEWKMNVREKINAIFSK